MLSKQIYSKTINYKWENGIQCSTCFEELSNNEMMYSSGRCPHCGTKSSGANTIVKTKDFAFRRVTYINVFLFLYFIPYFTIRKARYTRDFTIPRSDLTKKENY